MVALVPGSLLQQCGFILELPTMSSFGLSSTVAGLWRRHYSKIIHLVYFRTPLNHLHFFSQIFCENYTFTIADFLKYIFQTYVYHSYCYRRELLVLNNFRIISVYSSSTENSIFNITGFHSSNILYCIQKNHFCALLFRFTNIVSSQCNTNHHINYNCFCANAVDVCRHSS